MDVKDSATLTFDAIPPQYSRWMQDLHGYDLTMVQQLCSEGRVLRDAYVRAMAMREGAQTASGFDPAVLSAQFNDARLQYWQHVLFHFQPKSQKSRPGFRPSGLSS